MIGAGLDILIAALLVLGGVFGLVGSYGLLRLKGAMQRLHAPTKASTVGLGAVLMASAIGAGSTQEILVTLFIFLTAPLTALYLAKTLLHRHITPAELPTAAGCADWAAQSPAQPPVAQKD
jgi:multicomponent K+:H+ antiporter subunit G